MMNSKMRKKGKNYLFLIQAEHKLLKIHISFVDFAQHSQELESATSRLASRNESEKNLSCAAVISPS